MIDYHVSGGLALARLNAPPLNTIDFALLESLRAAIARANAEPGVQGIVILGDSEHFSAGADLGWFREIACAEDAVRVSRVFQEAFQAVEDSPKPVVAAVAGNVIAGALELAMACHFRVAANQARFSMKEITLGINPGAGGTQRLPRLVGLGKALRMLLTAETVRAPEALELGLVDAVGEGDRLVETARDLLRSPSNVGHVCNVPSTPRKTSRRDEKLKDAAANRAAFDEAERLAAGMRPEIIAPRRIIEAVRAGVEESVEAGFVREQAGFAECMGSPAAQNKIYLFFATRATSKLPELADVAPVHVSRAAVVGMGTMGTGIAQALITAGVTVAAFDQDESALARGASRVRDSVQKRVAQGRLSTERAAETLALLSTTARWEDMAGAELVIEAVFENVDAKRAVLRRIERACGPEGIIATNTSTISLDVLAASLELPERLVGMHFFNPAHRMPLVEIVRRSGTSPAAIATAIDVTKRLGKTPVVVNNREGFLVTRLFVPYLKEAFWLLEEGVDPAAIDGAMVEFGMPMGPLALIDMAGLDILALTDQVLRRAFPWHGPLPAIAARLVERGQLGQKSGSGVYKYEKGDYTPRRSPSAEAIIAEVRKDRGGPRGHMPAHEIAGRLVLRMVGEAFYVMEEGVAGRESDLDVALVLGTGFPDFRGGVLKYAHDLGLDQVVVQLDALAKNCGERFSPCSSLREKSRILRERKGA
jgi:3-hydroxyacyl-CoA dehydrogenase